MKYLITLLLAVNSLVALSQETAFKRNVVFIEAFGPGGLGSINYEYQLLGEPRLGIRVGVGYFPIMEKLKVIPMGINYLINISKNTSFIDVGLTISHVFNNRRYGIDVFPSVGFRRHISEDWMFRFSFTPVIDNEMGFFPWMGISVGRRF